MSDLLRTIHDAQMQAGEDAVVDDLRRKGLLPSKEAVPPRTALIGSLDDVEALIRAYVAHLAPRERLTTQLTFSMFILWLKKREETNSGDTKLNT